jgi:hypothetical protein
LGKRPSLITLKKKKAANPYGCGFFVNYPAWIRTRTKRAKKSGATPENMEITVFFEIVVQTRNPYGTYPTNSTS